MTSAEIRRRRRLLIGQRALRGYEDLPASERIELFLGLADVLKGAEGCAARATAWTIQASETQQLNFAQLFNAAPKS